MSGEHDVLHPSDRPKVIVLISLAGIVMSGQAMPPGVHYVKEWDVDAADGVGLEMTDDLAQAKVYPGFREAFLAYRATPVRHPTRFDGKPNRPLTAFHVEIRDAP